MTLHISSIEGPFILSIYTKEKWSRGQNRMQFKPIMEIVCKVFDLTHQQLIGNAKAANYIMARFVLYYVARKYTPMTFEEIAMRIGNRDHSTIQHGVRRMETLLSMGDEEARVKIDSVVEQLALAGYVAYER